MRDIKAQIFLLILFLSLLPLSQPHVVFEEIGLMTGSMSYMHCTLTLDLGLIEDMVGNGIGATHSNSTLIEKIYYGHTSLTD